MELKLVDIKGRLEFFAGRADKGTEECRKAIVATNLVLRNTRSYCHELQAGYAVDPHRENELAKLWEDAGELMYNVDSHHANTLFRKAQYWTCTPYYELSGQADGIPTLEDVEETLTTLLI